MYGKDEYIFSARLGSARLGSAPGWRRKAALISVLAIVAGWSCSGQVVDGPGGEDETVATAGEAIVAGTDDDSTPYKFPCVGRLETTLDDGYSKSCTATLIGCGVAITASHCASYGPDGKLRASKIDMKWLQGDYLPPSESPERKCGSWVVDGRFAFEDLADETGQLPAESIGKDVAVLVLRSSTQLQTVADYRRVQQYPYVRLASPGTNLRVGDSATFVGYGWVAFSHHGQIATHFPRRYADFTVNSLDDLNGARRLVAQSSSANIHSDEGDSGGPFLLPDEHGGTGWVLHALLSSTGQQAPHASYLADVTAPATSAWLKDVLSKMDADHDGIVDQCDPCPTSADPTDSDNDLMPDACDLCPCDPYQVDPIRPGDILPDGSKRDTDGVCACDPTLSTYCASYCNAHPGDNCPSVNNPEQANCNFDAEKARGAKILGDACDPVPCPNGTAKSTVVHETKIKHGPVETVTTDFVNDRFVIEKIQPHYRLQGAAKKGDLVDLEAADYRFCSKAFHHLVDCAPNSNTVRDALLRPGQTAETEDDQTTTWRRVTMATVSPAGSFLIGRNDRDLQLRATKYYQGTDECDKLPGQQPRSLPLYCSPTYERKWLLGQDVSRWGWSGMNDSRLNVKGGFWFHAQTPVGTTDDTYGIHTKADSDEPGESLANHYLKDFAPKEKHNYAWGTPSRWAPEVRVWLERCPMCGVTVAPWDARVRESVLLTDMDDIEPGHYGMLTRDGMLEDVTDQLGPALRTSLGDRSAQWLSPVEPNPLMGRGTALPVAVALSQDTTMLQDAVFAHDGKLLGMGDREVFVPDGDNIVPGSRVMSAPAQNTTPPARTDEQAIYSRAAGAVFVVGGTEAGSQQRLHDIWRLDMQSHLWTKVLTTFKPEHVLAATYAFGDRKLWILDEQGSGWHKHRRLTRVDPTTGQVEQLGRWPSFGLFDKLWLLVDQDGHVVLASSSTRFRRHMLLRLKVNSGGKLRVTGGHLGRWDLPVRPNIDMAGIWLVKHPTRHGARVQRLDSLRSWRHGHHYGRLSWCMR